MGEGKLGNACNSLKVHTTHALYWTLEADAKFPGQHGTGGYVEPPSPTRENPGQVRVFNLHHNLSRNCH